MIGNHHTNDDTKHRISKYEVYFNNHKFELLKDVQDRWETRVEIPLGEIKPPKKTGITIRLTCSLSGSKNYHFEIQ